MMVTDLESGRLVGTYRLQTGEVARKNLGYYGNQVFDFSVYEPIARNARTRPRLRTSISATSGPARPLEGIAVYATRNESPTL
jgi:hypothetical protein